MKLSELVAANVRWLVDDSEDRRELLRAYLRVTGAGIDARLSGAKPFTVDELATVAELARVPITSLFVPHPEPEPTGGPGGDPAGPSAAAVETRVVDVA